MRNLQEQVKKAFCYQKLFWPFTVWINCSSDLKNFKNSRPSASNFKNFSRSLEQFFLTVGQNNFGDKIPFLLRALKWNSLWISIPMNFDKIFQFLQYFYIKYLMKKNVVVHERKKMYFFQKGFHPIVKNKMHLSKHLQKKVTFLFCAENCV